jgi:hypothetical protein
MPRALVSSVLKGILVVDNIQLVFRVECMRESSAQAAKQEDI